MSKNLLTTAELRKLSEKDLSQELITARHQAATLTLELRTEKSKATHEVRALRGYIARIMTVMTELRMNNIIEEAKPTNA